MTKSQAKKAIIDHLTYIVSEVDSAKDFTHQMMFYGDALLNADDPDADGMTLTAAIRILTEEVKAQMTITEKVKEVRITCSCNLKQAMEALNFNDRNVERAIEYHKSQYPHRFEK